MERKYIRQPNKIEALAPIAVLLTIMISNYILDWGADPHIPVMIASAVAMIVGLRSGHSYQEMLAGALDSISQSLEAILIILFVGCLIGAFEWAGTIPAVVYYGLKTITPRLFLPLACILSAAVALALGSSWTLTATLGIAFMAIGRTMGINEGLIAGMIISGATVGDKFSPLSDSTNLAAGSSQTGLFDHVRAMVTTTMPSLLIAIGIYAVISLSISSDYDPTVAVELSDTIVGHYDFMSPILLIPLVLIIAVAGLKLPAIPGVLLISAIGAGFAVVFQGANFADILDMFHYGYSVETGNQLADALMNRGGMDSMLWTNNLVIVAVGFGGILQTIGAVESLIGGLIKKVKTPFQLVLVTMLTSIFCITTMCDQYLGLIIPSAMYKDEYDKMGLSRSLLSRSMEDSGTLWSPLVPWSSCGAYHSSILGVSVLSYAPFAFMNLINPIFALITIYFGRNVIYADGSYTNLFGREKQLPEPEAPEEAKEIAFKALEELRAKAN